MKLPDRPLTFDEAKQLEEDERIERAFLEKYGSHKTDRQVEQLLKLTIDGKQYHFWYDILDGWHMRDVINQT